MSGTVFHPWIYYTGSGYGIISDDEKESNTALSSTNNTSWSNSSGNTWMIRVMVDDDIGSGVESASLGTIKAAFK